MGAIGWRGRGPQGGLGEDGTGRSPLGGQPREQKWVGRVRGSGGLLGAKGALEGRPKDPHQVARLPEESKGTRVGVPPSQRRAWGLGHVGGN